MTQFTQFILFLSLLIPTFGLAAVPPEFIESGSGTVRYLGFIKVYRATLFVPENVKKEELLTESTSRCLQLNYEVDLSVDNFIEAAETILKDQHNETDLAGVRSEIDKLHGSYRDVADGDQYILCYDAPSQNTSLFLNGDLQTTINSADFARIYFGIWLGSKEPLSDSLRDDLIAGLK